MLYCFNGILCLGEICLNLSYNESNSREYLRARRIDLNRFEHSNSIHAFFARFLLIYLFILLGFYLFIFLSRIYEQPIFRYIIIISSYF